MIRYPDGTRPTIDNSLVKLNRHSDYKINTSGIVDNIYGSPDRINNPRAIKNKNYPNILDSERHRALINFYNNPENINTRNVTQDILTKLIHFYT